VLFRPSAWVIAGAAIMATTGVAHAQQRPAAPVNPTAEARANDAAVPWYQRFTTSNGVTESITGVTENDRQLAPAWTLNQRWGVTVDVREAQRIERIPDSRRGDEASLGAYYQFTPRMRVGGQLSVETENRSLTTAPADPSSDEPHADVRIESAFRF
jgi:hypothetical protein